MSSMDTSADVAVLPRLRRDGGTGRRWLPAAAALRIAGAALAVVALAAAVLLPGCTETDHSSRKRFRCANNLSQLAGLFVAENADPAPGWTPTPGPALFLAWRRAGRKIRAGEEAVLICPYDPLAHVPSGPGERAAYDTVDLTKAPRALCSYAVRDFAAFPLGADPATPEPIAACVHHGETFTTRGGVNVAYSDGEVRFLGYEELGVSSSDDVTVGPASKAPLLRTLIYGDGSVR